MQRDEIILQKRFERSQQEAAYLNESSINNFTHSTIKGARELLASGVGKGAGGKKGRELISGEFTDR